MAVSLSSTDSGVSEQSLYLPLPGTFHSHLPVSLLSPSEGVFLPFHFVDAETKVQRGN